MKFPSSMHIDIMELEAETILEWFGQPDVIWAGFDCTTFLVATIGFHRMEDPASGSLLPKTEKAPRGTKLGLQAIKDRAERSKYPPRLFEHIVEICERYFDNNITQK